MRYLIIFYLIVASTSVMAQKSVSIPQLGNQILIDSASTLMMPVLYDAKLFDSNTSLALFDNYYANIMFYNYLTDSTKMLFDHDVFILAFDSYTYDFNKQTSHRNLMTVTNVFYQVRSVDHNGNNKIDDEDPAMLYVSDRHGNNLKQLTDDTENVVDVKIYNKQNFAMIKIQRDADGNKRFDYRDRRYYYVKLDLITLRLGRKIEL